MMLVQTSSVIADPDRPRQRLERPGARRRPGALAAALALPPPPHARRRCCSRVAAGAISWRLLAWMSPALLGLVLAVPLSAFMGSAAAGRRLARMGLLMTPEERTPPPIAAAADARGRGAPRPGPGAGRARRASSPIPAAFSRATSPGSTRRPRGGRASPTPPSAARSSSSPTASPLERLDAARDLRGARLARHARGPRAAPVGRSAAGEVFVMLAATAPSDARPDLDQRRSPRA